MEGSFTWHRNRFNGWWRVLARIPVDYSWYLCSAWIRWFSMALTKGSGQSVE